MATSKWKQVKVKVKGKMVTRWTDGKTFRLSKPGLISGLRQAATSGLKKGDYNVGRTKQWDGKKYVPVNVTRAGQKATLNGKSVVADGKGNWRTPAPNSISGYGAKVGTYKPGNRTSGSKTTDPSGGVTAAQRAELKKKNEARIAKIKKDSDAKVKAGRNDPKSPFYKAPSGGGGGSNTPPAGSKPKPKPKSKIHTYKKHGSDLHIGRHKTLKQHQKAAAARKAAEKKDRKTAPAFGPRA